MIHRACSTVLILTLSTFAGSFSGWSEKDVTSDPSTNTIYIGINKVFQGPISRSTKIAYDIVNYMIFNPSDSTKRFIFSQAQQKNITLILFETKYDSSKQAMIFNGAQDNFYAYKYNPEFIVNNEFIEERTPKDKMVFVLSHGYDKPYELWTCTKKGEMLKMLSTIESKQSWHIDIRNSKLRIVTQKGFETSIKQFEW